jgi:hypothetical protein
MANVSHPCKVTIEQSHTGLARFFRPENLDRYRKLASDVTDVAQRRTLLEALAKELKSFRREAYPQGFNGSSTLGAGAASSTKRRRKIDHEHRT